MAKRGRRLRIFCQVIRHARVFRMHVVRTDCLAAYFAYLVGVWGRSYCSYLRAMVLYYPLTIFFFLPGFRFMLIWPDVGRGENFLTNIIPASLTALATAAEATIPLNLEAAEKSGAQRYQRSRYSSVRRSMDGSCYPRF